MSKDKVRFNAIFTEDEMKELDHISERVLGKKNKTAIIRYWINRDKNERTGKGV